MSENWPKEEIPDEDDLYMRVHKQNLLEDGTPKPGAFRDQGDPEDATARKGMSTDWSEYSTPEQSKDRARNPALNGVVSLKAGSVRTLPDLLVDHDPKPTNRAHTNVYGEKTAEVRQRLREMAVVLIRTSVD